jgi:hypothetical protein
MQAHNTHYIHYVCNCLMNCVLFSNNTFVTLVQEKMIFKFAQVREAFVLMVQRHPITIDPLQ